MIPTKLNSKKIQSKLFYIITFCMAVVLVSLIMIHPTEVKAEDLSVCYPVNGTQNATSLGATTKESSKVSLFKASSFTIHYQTVNSTTNKVHKHTLTYKFRSLGGKYDTAPMTTTMKSKFRRSLRSFMTRVIFTRVSTKVCTVLRVNPSSQLLS